MRIGLNIIDDFIKDIKDSYKDIKILVNKMNLSLDGKKFLIPFL